MTKKLIIAFFFINALSVTAVLTTQAEDTNKTEISGYYKTLYTTSKLTDSDENYYAATNRLRLEFKKQVNPWQFYLTLDNEAVINDFANTSDFDSIRNKNQHNLAAVDMDKVSVDNDHLYLRHSVYRAYMKYYQPEFQATVGKQGIDWGKMRFYSPLDVFNSVGSLDLEPDERVGIDAVNLNFSPEAFAGLNVVAAPGENNDESSGGIKLFKKISTYDAALIAATVKKEQIYGLSFDGYIQDAGFRGEIAHTQLDSGRRFPRASLGLDYNFTEKFYALVEQFYNGGHDDNDLNALSSSYLTARQIMSLKENLSSLWLKYSLTPLWTANQYIIYDWDGKSIALNPEMVYSWTKNIDLKLGTQLYWGQANSEFGGYEHLYYAEFKLFF